MKKLLALLLGIAWLFSCAPFSKNLMDQVDPSLTFSRVRENPSAFEGKTVVWGGVVVETLNDPEETLVIVRQTDLDLEQRPRNYDRSQGRFIIRYSGFLDPAIYREGREITVAGEVMGEETLPLGEILYRYPVVAAKEMHLWERIPLHYPIYPSWVYDPFYPYGWYRPYWRHPYWWW